MRTTVLMAAIAALLLTTGPTLAQTASAPSTTSASAPGAGQPGPMHRGGRWGTDFTPGWSMMTPQERKEHQDKMRGMVSAAECKTYMDEHHRQMADRAKEKGVTLPAKPRRNACAGLPN
ncbi:MAG TPA: hypothetical protein VFY73_14030 [Ideonella sp.]|uniref:hypothetical protein n=1 Tax=Ideonella sp. TaxID=1929293 RepID=UPI002E2EC273|nr:hypothetical protein [Ideonella sp.]HEX5685136.1 hypothetical protein [Ideonella sp.]